MQPKTTPELLKWPPAIRWMNTNDASLPYKCIIYGSEDSQCLLAGIHYPHQDKSLSFGFFSLGQVKVHFITVKVSIIRSAYALVEPERPVRFDSGLWDEEEENNCDIWQQTKQQYRSTIGIKTRGFTIWAMMLSLCRDGCRLKSTMSPSIRCLSTTSPSLSSWAIFSRFPYFKNLKEDGIIFCWWSIFAPLTGWRKIFTF